MSTLFFLLFGFLDISVLLLLVFKIFRWPYLPFLGPCLIIASVCSFESYITRFIIQFSQLDLLIQIITIMVMIRYLMGANLYYAMFMSVIGALVYSEVVFFTYSMLELVGVVGNDDAAATTTFGIFLVQIVGQLTGILTAITLQNVNAGFSFISTPPHDAKRNFNRSEKINLAINTAATILIASTTNWVISFGGYGVRTIMVIELIALVVLLFMARRLEYAND